MATLQVREVPATLYGALAEASKQEHRSLSQQTLVILERGLGLEEKPAKRRKRLIRSIEETPLPAVDKLPDPVSLVREDRRR